MGLKHATNQGVAVGVHARTGNAQQDVAPGGVLPPLWANLRGWGKHERRGIFQTFNWTILTASLCLQAGTGFLAQHSKEVFFGLGRPEEAIRATVRWPSGLSAGTRATSINGASRAGNTPARAREAPINCSQRRRLTPPGSAWAGNSAAMNARNSGASANSARLRHCLLDPSGAGEPLGRARPPSGFWAGLCSIVIGGKWNSRWKD